MGSIEALFSAAAKAGASAYAPYSGFSVEAALCTDSGAIFSGTNVENAAFPVGTCAEAAAIVGAGDALATPCGACRQRLREFAGEDAKIHIAGTTGVRATFTLGELLPAAFGLSTTKGSQP